MWQVTVSNRQDVLVGDYVVPDIEDNFYDIYRIQDGILKYIKSITDSYGFSGKNVEQYEFPFDPTDSKLVGKTAKVAYTSKTFLYGKIVSIFTFNHDDIKKGDWLVRVEGFIDLFLVPGSKERLV